MAKKSLITFSHPDGYRFVDDTGSVTAVLEATGQFSLRGDNASLEVFESWQDFVRTMQEDPTKSYSEDDIFRQLSNMGLGECQPIDVEPKQTHKRETPEMAGATTTSIADKKKKLEELQAQRKAATKTAKAPKEPKEPKAPAVLNDCLCGCGEKTARNFKQGHDARVHGWGKKIGRGEMKFNDIPVQAQRFLKDHGVTQGVKAKAS